MATEIAFSDADKPLGFTGECPDCGGAIPLRDGRIPPHKERIIRHGREVEGDQQCTPETTEEN